MATVDEDSELDARRAAESEQRVDAGSDRAARVEDVVDENDGLALERERDARRPDDRLPVRGSAPVAHLHVVAMEGDVERSELQLAAASLGDQPAQAGRERDSASLDPDERDSVEIGLAVRVSGLSIALDQLVGDPRQCPRDRIGIEERLGPDRIEGQRWLAPIRASARECESTSCSFPASLDRVKGSRQSSVRSRRAARPADA